MEKHMNRIVQHQLQYTFFFHRIISYLAVFLYSKELSFSCNAFSICVLSPCPLISHCAAGKLVGYPIILNSERCLPFSSWIHNSHSWTSVVNSLACLPSEHTENKSMSFFSAGKLHTFVVIQERNKEYLEWNYGCASLKRVSFALNVPKLVGDNNR